MKFLINILKSIFFKRKEEKFFRVKIIKCSNQFSWYYKKIGSEYLVENAEGDDDLYITVEKEIANYHKGYIKKDEAIIKKDK